ncbi:Diphosphomevalonate decarboxylase, partial [Stegodyphus mimosarum]
MSFSMYTAVAPVNIAVIKYWGKRNEDLILPVNDSISVTLSKDIMSAKTTVACSEHFKSDKIWLNGKEEDITNPRLQKCIEQIKKCSRNKKCLKWHLHICSKNNFPTAAGLASSAAGFACLVKALAALYDVDDELSLIARQGSGSACRSMFGGFVRWLAGQEIDGSDSLAIQIAAQEFWPELKVIILVVNANKKGISSTIGMKRSVLTSSLLKYRASDIVPARVEEITEAILQQDFEKFAEITMKDSNQFHAICLDTFPPVHYLNSISYVIMEFVHAYNDFYHKNKVAYTFDAGPNACLFLMKQDVSEVISLIKNIFPPSTDGDEFIRGLDVSPCDISEELLKSIPISPQPDSIRYIINTEVGTGPEIIQDPAEHLLNEFGLPL